MASFDYNPITGQLDLVGSGGGSYIDGEVEYHSSLPVSVGSPAVNSAFLVRKGEGLYFISRKPAGIWVRELNNGNLDDWKYAGTFSDLYRDANFRIINDADTSKELAFSLSGITTGTTRTLTVPDASGTIARTEDFAAPPAIGSTTPNTGAFTTLTAKSSVSLISADGNSFLTLEAFNNASNDYKIRSAATNTLQFFSGNTALFAVRTDGAGYFDFGKMIRFGYPTVATFGFGSDDDGTGYWFRRTNNSPASVHIYNTWTNTSNYERGFIRWSSNVLQIGAEAAGTGTLRGLNIGTATSSLLGFYGVTPVDQPATVTDPTGGGTVDAEARTAINAIIDRLQELGLIA